MTATELLDRSRRRVLLGALIGFGVWYGLAIFDHLLGESILPRPIRLALVLISLTAWVYWSVQMIQVIRWIRRVRSDPALVASLNDERVQQSRMKAISLAFFAVLEVQAILLFVSIPEVVHAIPLLANVSTAMAAQLTILVGLTVAIGRFLVLEREQSE